ncbi:TonB-dependent receptor [Marinomonas mediterranea]|jgi:Outer membrane receptor proteins, mostly Fe transport|uniref:TonB-dependent receptor n=1 Tax=Marinomonas mediterranea (strain ATCC 700492 / JCM 21426 / NBRC 103028 / MMB-1) TaxID=717774 RepID=F2JYR2_MARM1|nr:TonB-dependent receptor [Marinomonas mediterranea]ADZ89687.1 TonB-dependent receptor [Marinomonas mediterranea MMB-1]WCN11876.1 TonB-dependent receptor [Marinomonas mediterranea]WCN15921.1 TonB-dependent receptor [Marinomonas mediterranea MMB-1]
MYRKLLPLGLVISLPLSILAANMAQAADETELDTLVIQSSRIDTKAENSPQVVTIISKEQIEAQLSISTDSSQALANLLPAYAPNTQKLNNASQTFRGRSILYMIDGVPQSNPLREGSRSAHTIDLSMVERIEVVHGATAIHGLGATGGIINFITKSTNTDTLSQHVGIQVTTPTEEIDGDTLSYKVNYQAQGSKGNLDYLIGLTKEEQGVFLDGNGDYVGSATTRGDIMDSSSYDAFVKLGYWFDDDQNIEFELNQYQLEGNMNFSGVSGDRDNGVATSSIKGTPEGKAPFNKVQTTSITYTDSDLNGMTLKAQAFHQDFKGRYGATKSGSFQDTSIAPSGQLYDQSQNESEKIGAKFSLSNDELLDDTLKVTGGLDLMQDTTSQKLILTDRVYVPETVYENYAPFIQLEYQPIERLVLQGGIRYETAKLDIDTYQTVAARNGVTVDGGSPEFDETVYNAGAVFKITPSISLFANYSQGFGMPDVGRVLRGVSTTGQDVDTLIDLSPILTDNYETGVRFNNKAVDFEISYYESKSKLGSRIVENDGLYTVKREKKEIKGAEASVGIQLNEQHKVSTSYSYIEGKSDTDNDGKVDTKLTGADIPPNRIIASWQANWNDKLSSLLQASHALDRSFDDEELEFDGYTLFDASVGYKLPVGQLNVSVANLLDEDYFTYYSQSAYKNDDFYFKGRGRTVTVAYGLDF